MPEMPTGKEANKHSADDHQPGIGNIASVLTQGAEILGICLPPRAFSSFEHYYDLLLQRGQRTNLTAIDGAADVARLHFLDSIALLGASRFEGRRVIDIGSGAGFPGVPLKIAEPTIDLTLLDATGKRIAFLSDLCAALGIGAAFVHSRAEEAAHESTMRESYDIALARAVAKLNVLCELCLPFVRVGGKFLAMKAIDSNEEISDASYAISALGGKLAGFYDYPIPMTDMTRRVVIINKTEPTKSEYPRRFAKIQNKPLI